MGLTANKRWEANGAAILRWKTIRIAIIRGKTNGIAIIRGITNGIASVVGSTWYFGVYIYVDVIRWHASECDVFAVCTVVHCFSFLDPM